MKIRDISLFLKQLPVLLNLFFHVKNLNPSFWRNKNLYSLKELQLCSPCLASRVLNLSSKKYPTAI